MRGEKEGVHPIGGEIKTEGRSPSRSLVFSGIGVVHHYSTMLSRTL